METRAGAHPSTATLQAFALGKLEDASAESVAAHLVNCSACQKQAAAVTGDDFLARLRDAHDRSGTPAPAKSLYGLPSSQQAAESPSPTPLPAPGLPPELAGHPQYQLLRELGRGGMGVVYLAKNRLLGRLEVLKVMNKSLLEKKPAAAERFLREIQSAALLNHPNVVTAYTALELGGSLALAMEYVEGQDLAKIVKERGPLAVGYACYYIREAAMGLQHAFEKKMVHRDIKPQNLILARDGAKHLVKILDFGLAKVLREDGDLHELTGSGMMLGTPDYMAPEQTVDAANIDIRADIYSLGCTLYFLLTGRAPFQGNSVYAILHAHHSVEATAVNVIRPEVSEELAAVVRKMMAKKPEQRYQTPIEVAQALMPFIKQGTNGRPNGGSVAQQAGIVASETKPSALAVKGAPAASVDTVIGGTPKAVEVPKSRPTPAAKPLTKKGWIGAGAFALLTIVLLLGLLGLWAGGVFKVKTKDGTIVLENLPADADVTVDGGTVTLSSGEENKIQISVAADRKHRLEIKKDGFALFSKEIELDVDGKSVVVRLEPDVAAKDDPVTKDDKTQPQPPKVVDQDKLTAGRVLRGHQGKVVHLAFSPDGKQVLSGSSTNFSDRKGNLTYFHPGKDNTIRLWDVETAQQLLVLRGPWGVSALTFCPTNSQLVAAGFGYAYQRSTIGIYNWKTGEKLHTITQPPKGIFRGVTFSADETRLIACNNVGKIESWNLTKKEMLPTVTLETTEPTSLRTVFTADGRRLLTGQGEGPVRLWDVETGKVMQVFLGHSKRVLSVALSADEKQMASAAEDGTIRIWDIDSGNQLLCLVGHDKPVRGVAFSPDGRWLLSGGEDDTVRLWDTAMGEELQRFEGHSLTVNCVAISPNGRLAASGSDDATIRLWELP